MASLKQKVVTQVLIVFKEYYIALKSIPSVRTEYELKTFMSVVTPIVPEDMIIRWCDQVRSSVVSEKKTTVVIHHLAFLVGFDLPLTPLIFQVLKMIVV